MSPLQPWLLILFSSSVMSVVMASVKVAETKSCDEFERSSPLPAVVYAPEAAGSYPVIVFHHGTFCGNEAYSTILQAIAKRGFVIAAPAANVGFFYPFTAEWEIRDAKRFITWLSQNLNPFMEQCMGLTSVQADFNKLVGMGHSRGGKVAFALARGLVTEPVGYSTIIGLDPVDRSPQFPLPPSVLDSTFELPYPALLIGSGLGPQGCAPKAFSYMAFFAKMLSPTFEFVAHHDGHLDFLDGVPWWQSRMCDKGSRKHAQEVAINTTLAFLEAALLGDCGEFKHLLMGPSFVNSRGVLKNCSSSVASA